MSNRTNTRTPFLKVTVLISKMSATRAARKFFLENSLPWLKRGERMVPRAILKEFRSGMRKIDPASTWEETTDPKRIFPVPPK